MTEQQRNAHVSLTQIKYHHDQVTPQQLDSWVEEVRAAIAERDKAVGDVRKLREALKLYCDHKDRTHPVTKALSDTAGYEE